MSSLQFTLRTVVTEAFLILPRRIKQMIVLMSDVLLLNAALYSSFSLRLDTWYQIQGVIWGLFIIIPFLSIPIFVSFGLYQTIIRYFGLGSVWLIIRAISFYALLWGVAAFLSGIDGIPRSVMFINWMFSLLFLTGSRALSRYLFSHIQTSINPIKVPNRKKSNVLVYGAGTAGIQLISSLIYDPLMHPVGFIDDDKQLHGKYINGLRVYAFKDLSKIIAKYTVMEVLLALPSLSHNRRKEVFNALEPYPIRVRTLPGKLDLSEGKIGVNSLRPVSIGDLLSRSPVPPQKGLLEPYVTNKSVMITGAGGSIGSEICRQVITLHPKIIVLYEQSEFALFSIEKELLEIQSNIFSETKIVSLLGTVTDFEYVKKTCLSYAVNTVYHTAAYKHVPLVESNIISGVENNIFGTLRCAHACRVANVERFVLISTDKAVRPTNVMGASKRFAELILQNLSQESPVTRFIMVRFGNVLGSSGSVIPLFQKQIDQKIPITVTDPEIIRYFMTIPEAAQLVLQAGSMGNGGEIFLLNMGEPVKIFDLAKKMIRLNDLKIKNAENPQGDIEIQFTGLRPGEKLYEELLIDNNAQSTSHPRIMKGQEKKISSETVNVILEQLEEAVKNHDAPAAKVILKKAMPEYIPS